MYEIDPKFFSNDGSLDVEAACAAGRKARARIVSHGAKRTSGWAAKAVGAVVGAVGKMFVATPNLRVK